jgi:AraC-like DNA-binding protein
VENIRFICVAEGNMNYQVGNYLLHCKEGDFIFIPPRFPHPGNRHASQLAHSAIPGEVCTLVFMAQYHRGFQCWQSQYGTEHRIDSAAENYLFSKGQVIQLFELLIEEFQAEQNDALCNSLLLSFMLCLSREVSAGRYLHPGPIVKKETSTKIKNEFIQNLEEYIEQHLNEHLTLESVSHHFYTSRAQFVRQMRRETGQTFVEFLTNYRIREAKTLLRESEWTAQTIARFVGFKSPVYFHKLFVGQTGCTPGQYRLKNMSR